MYSIAHYEKLGHRSDPFIAVFEDNKVLFSLTLDEVEKIILKDLKVLLDEHITVKSM